MTVNKLSIYRVDTNESDATQVTIDYTHEGIGGYLTDLFTSLSTERRGRQYIFSADTTEVRHLITLFLENKDFSSFSNNVVRRLHRAQKEAQTSVNQLGIEIQGGVIVLAVVSEDEVANIVICKLENNEFLEKSDFSISSGFPVRKKIYKSFVCTINNDKQDVSSILVYDTNQKEAKYWWSNFLELTPVISNEANTENAFQALDKKVFTPLKRDYPQDYLYLRNSTVRYFRGTSVFEISEYIDTAIGDYSPYDQGLDVNELKSKILNLPTSLDSSKRFDSQFLIVPDIIKAKIRMPIKLTPQIDLILKEDVPNIDTVITAFVEGDGQYFVKIKSEVGYRYFNIAQKPNASNQEAS